MKGNTRQLLSMIFVFTVIAVAYACRILGKFDIGGAYTNYFRSALYLLLFAWWGFTIDRRIIQKQVLHCLRLTALLMLLWLVLRTLKYHVVTGVTAARYVWYLYYLPMLFLPLLGVYIALLLGKPEEYRLPGRARLLAIIPAVLFLLVITNDLHQWAFAFKDGVPGRPVSSAFTHRLLYFVCLVWMVACITFSLVRLFRKSRIPGGAQKRLTPFVLGCVTLLYGLLYLSGLPAVRWWFGDMNVTLCLLYAALYESCIRCRMIPSNTGYVELFEASTLAACIADPGGQIVLRSRAAGEDMVCPREGQRLIRPDGMRISSAPIGGGYVVWQDNVRPLLELPDYLDKLSAALGVRLCMPEDGARGDSLLLLEAEPLAVSVGIASMRKKGETVSGDRGTYFKTDAGQLCVILSDGMGCGESAADGSIGTVGMLEEFLRSGVSPTLAMKLLNSAMLLRDGENWGYATVDLMCMNLFTGEADFYKYGAAPTYVKSGGALKKLRCTSFAPGLEQESGKAPDELHMHLKPGSVAVIASDGVVSDGQDLWLRRLLNDFEDGDMKTLAGSVVRAAIREYGRGDDMTALAVKVEVRS